MEFFSQTFSLNGHIKINKEIERHQSMPRMNDTNANPTQSQGNPVHFRIKNYRSLILGYQREKWLRNNRKTANAATNCAKRLDKHKKNIIFLWLGSVSKTRRIDIKRKREARNILQNTRFSAKTGCLESQQFILRTILVITFHKLYQQHRERLS